MLKLYHVPISFNSRRVWVALLEKGLDFELVQMKLDGDQFQPDFLALNPFHHIPVLVDDDLPVFESLAILDYLEAKYPTPSLLPTEPQALAIVRMVEMVTVNELLPATRPLVQQSMGLTEVDSAQLEQAQKQVATVLSTLEKWLGVGPYFSGDRLTLADIVAGTVVPILPTLGVSLNNYPALQEWIKRLRQRPSWQQTEATPEQIEAFKAKMRQLMAKNKPGA
jgi:glutathione S-transferase